MRQMLLRSFLTSALTGAALLGQPPATPKHPVTDTYHGVKITDDYRWLENAADPSVQAWSDAQNLNARHYLDALPSRAPLFEELKNLITRQSARYFAMSYRGGTLFALKMQPPSEQAILVTLKSADDLASERVIVDPNRLDSKGGIEIDFYVPSLDGKRVAVSMSKGGSESGDVTVYDVASAAALPGLVPRVNGGTAGGSLAWNQDGSGFWYTRYPRAGERPPADLDFFQQVYFHKLGADTSADTYAIGKDFPRIAEIALTSSEDGRYVLAQMANGDGGDFAHYLLTPSGQWTQIATYTDEVPQVAFGPGGQLYMLTRRNAPLGRIVSVPLDRPLMSNAKTVVPESKNAIQFVVPTAHRLYVVDQAGGPEQVRVFPAGGGTGSLVPLPPVSSVGGVVRTSGDDVLLLSGTLPRAAGMVSLRRRSGETGAHRAARDRRGRFQRLRSGPRIRHLKGRRQNPAEHYPPQGNEARRK